MEDTNEKWLYRDLTQKIIGAAMEVHRELSCQNPCNLWL